MSEVSPKEAVIWGIMKDCWVREPTERLQCEQILQVLESNGLSRGGDKVGSQWMDSKRKFVEAMRKAQELPLELNKIERLLDSLL